MADQYFSDSEKGPKPRINEEISGVVWGGLVAAINGMINVGAFDVSFTDHEEVGLAIKAEIEDIIWPLNPYQPPGTLPALDLVQFCHRHVVDIEHTVGDMHDRRRWGQEDFREKINLIFLRNGLLYELTDKGEIVRIALPVAGEKLAEANFKTGDTTLDSLLEDARTKFFDPDISVRRIGLEKLWDAWERLKTILPGDKKTSANALIDRAAGEPQFKTLLEKEATALNDIGNSFHIRHFETDKVDIVSSEQVDYLFLRMFSIINLFIRFLNHRS